MAKRPTFEQAKAQYVHRYTMEHVPAWSQERPDAQRNGDPIRPGYYAPHFRTDLEWYEHTLFPGEAGHFGGKRHAYTTGQTFPLGIWLEKPFHK